MLTLDYKDSATGQLTRWAALVPRAAQAGNQAVAQMAAPILRREIQRIYNRPIPRSKTGRPLWARTGALRASPQKPDVSPLGMQIRFAGRPAVPIRNWPGGYAEKRSAFVSKRGWRQNNYIGHVQTALRVDGPVVFEEAFKRELGIK